MESSATTAIVDALTKAIVEHRLQPGSKLAEQKLADHFGVSRTLVRQALFQLSQNRLIRLEPARVISASSMRRTANTSRAFVREVTPERIRSLREHVAAERTAVAAGDATGRTELLGDFHVRMAQLMGNRVLAQMLGELISRCALITLMYQSPSAAAHSNDEHAAIVRALAAKDEERAVRLMTEHLAHVEASLTFDRKVPTHDIALALA